MAMGIVLRVLTGQNVVMSILSIGSHGCASSHKATNRKEKFNGINLKALVLFFSHVPSTNI